ncbi:MAG TPA: hypothetical protein VF266_14955 [Thermoanaerobaculia bacterium]
MQCAGAAKPRPGTTISTVEPPSTGPEPRAAVALLASLTAVCGEGTPQSVISGQVVETYCWAKLGVGGPQHAACGIECVNRGIPAAVFDKESHQLFILLPGQDKMAVPADLIAAMGHA